jgi:hypothetical protein
MRFKEFLLEDKPKTHSIVPEGAVEWIKKNCPKYAGAIEGKRKVAIYRGMDNAGDDGQFGDSNSFSRVASATDNYYTLFVDSSPRWNKMPKRSKSFVCTNNIATAHTFGKFYLVFPEDKANIAVCPTYDFWQSFRRLRDIGINNMKTFNHFLRELAEGYRSFVGGMPEIPQRDPVALREVLRVFDLDALRKIEIKKYERFSDSLHDLIDVMEDENWNTLEIAMEGFLDPIENGFKTVQAENFSQMSSDNDNEVWFSGKAVFIPADWLNKDTEFGKLMREAFNWYK